MTSSNFRKTAVRLGLVLAILSLAACNKSPHAPQPKGALRAGEWELTETVGSIEGPGIPPEAIEGLKAQWKRPTHTSCLAVDQVDKPPQEFFSEASGGCSYEHFSMSGGTISATINCPRTDGSHLVEISGTVKPESLHLNVNHILDSPNKSQRLAVDTSMEGKWVSNC